MRKVLEQYGNCPVATTITLLSSKWKFLIIRDLLQNDVLRYNQLRKSVKGISQKMLSQSLKEMYKDGLVDRKVYPEVPPKVEYRLTKLGSSILPVIISMQKWGNRYIDDQKNDLKQQHK